MKTISPIASLLALAVVALSWFFPRGVAAGETAVILSAKQAGKISSTAISIVEETIAQTLTDKNITVIGPKDAQMRMIGKSFQNCMELVCAPNVCRELGSDVTIVTTLWPAKNGAGELSSIALSVVDQEGHNFGAEATILKNNIQRATRNAINQALQRRTLGRYGHIRVATVPSGALVYLDGKPSGKTPFLRLAPAGAHVVVVQLKGYRAERRDVTVVPQQEQTVNLQLQKGDSNVLRLGVRPGAVVAAQPRVFDSMLPCSRMLPGSRRTESTAPASHFWAVASLLHRSNSKSF